MTKKWISVTEQLPDIDVPVWLHEPGRGIWIGARADDSDGWLWGASYSGAIYQDNATRAGCWEIRDLEIDNDYRPTFWMAMPDPPDAELSGRTRRGSGLPDQAATDLGVVGIQDC